MAGRHRNGKGNLGFQFRIRSDAIALTETELKQLIKALSRQALKV